MLTEYVGYDILQNMKRSFLKSHRELLWFLMFAAVTGAYFLLQFLPLEHRVVHAALDDRIPFLPGFIIPYILWYVYVPGLMLLMCFTDKQRFLRQAATLFSGAFICIAIFALWPSRVDFRPDAAGDGLLLWLCRAVYSSDQPYNVFPSLHCYEATAIFLASFGSGGWRRHKALCAVSGILAVLICLSTVFVKQHSVLDLLSGCTLAVLVYFAVKAIFDKKHKKVDQYAHISV